MTGATGRPVDPTATGIPTDGAALWRPVRLLTAARLMTNGAIRFTPPFLASVARSLGVPVERVGLALSISELAGLAAPAAGAVIDRTSRRTAMIAGLCLVAAGCLVGAVSPGLPWYGLALVVIGFAKIVFDAAMGAWVADRVAYARRGRVTGFVEMAWAGSYLLLIPPLAVVAQLTSWRVSLALVGVASLVFAGVVGRFVEADRPVRRHEEAARLTGLRRSIPVYVGVLLVMLAAQSVVVVFGAWLQDDLGFSTAAVGGVTFLLGLGELAASGSTMRFTDRLGKRRAMLLGATAMVPLAVALALWSGTAWLGIVLLVSFVAAFEFALVSILPLVMELHPEARARSITIGFGAGTIGRGIGAASSSWLYARHGMTGSALLAGAAAVAVLVVVGVFGRRSEPARLAAPAAPPPAG